MMLKKAHYERQSAMSAGIRRFRRFGVENMNVCARTLFAAETELLNISVASAFFSSA